MELFISSFADLPTDIILKVFRLLDNDTYVKDFFLYWPKTRRLVIESYYAKELHCIVSPLNVQKHVCIGGETSSEIYDLQYFGEIDDFLSANPDVFPRKLLFVCGGDFNSLNELFTTYESQILKSKNMDLIMEERSRSPISELYLLYILSFQNLHRLQLGHFDISKISSTLEKAFPKLSNLKIIQFLGHEVADWSNFVWPPNLESLDISWYKETNVLTLNINKNTKELYLNMSIFDSDTIKKLYDKLPADLKVLMLSYNYIPQVDGPKLPKSLEKLDILLSKVETLVDPSNEAGYFLPESLKEVNLCRNLLNDDALRAIRKFHWPETLKVLNLSGNYITDMYLLELPDSVEILDLGLNKIKFLMQGTIIKPFKFPKNLKELRFFENKELLTDINGKIPKNHIEFPEGLQKLTLLDCRISTLQPFKFPKLMTELSLVYNKLTSMETYEFLWAILTNLKSITIDSHVNTDEWTLPPNCNLENIPVH